MASKVTFPETKKKITASKLKDSKSYRGEITKFTRKRVSQWLIQRGWIGCAVSILILV